MTLDDMILVSVDDHIVEPPTVFANHIPTKWAERAPRLVYDPETATQGWRWEAGASTSTFINAVVTLPKEEWGFDPSTLAQIPMGRIAQPDEVATPCCFLLSDVASYITGQHLSVDGGSHIGF